MKSIDKIKKKIDKFLEKTTIEELIERLEKDELIQSDIEISFNTIIDETDYYFSNEKYKKKLNIKYSKFDYYNDYEEDNEWTSTKAS